MPQVGQGWPVARSMPHGGHPNCWCVPWPAGSGESIAAKTNGARQASVIPAALNRRPNVDSGGVPPRRGSGGMVTSAGIMRVWDGYEVMGSRDAGNWHCHSWRCPAVPPPFLTVSVAFCLHTNQAPLCRAQPRHTQNSTKSTPFSRLPPRTFLAFSQRALRSSRRDP